MTPPLPGRIAIRADGGGEIGLGHVMRCSALAGAFNSQGQRPLFITATPEYLPAGLDAVADIRCLDGDETGAGLSGYLASAGTPSSRPCGPPASSPFWSAAAPTAPHPIS